MSSVVGRARIRACQPSVAALRHNENVRLEARRLRAGELFAAGVRQAEVARQLEVSAQAVSVWHTRWQAGGVDALYSRGPSGPAPRLSDAQLATVEQALLEGASAHGFVIGRISAIASAALVSMQRNRLASVTKA